MPTCNGNDTAVVTSSSCTIPMIDFSYPVSNNTLYYGNNLVAQVLVSN